MRRVLQSARRFVFGKRLRGGKRTFRADAVKIAERPKIVQPYSQTARGIHGAAYDLIVYRGNHKVTLVIKKQHNRAEQSNIAKKEFAAFQRLKAKGYHVPPTVRLVAIRGRKYVALTDLSKFGDTLVKTLDQLYTLIGIGELKVNERELARVENYVQEETERALREEKIPLSDSWQYVIDSKSGAVRAFILDLGRYSQPLTGYSG